MAENCPGNKYVGRSVPALIAFACGSEDYNSVTYLPIGAVNTKSFELTSDKADATADDNVSGIKSSLATYAEYSVSVDGKARVSDGTASNQTALLKYFAAEMKALGADASRQPTLYVRLIYPDVTITAYCIIDSYSRDAPDGDVVTYSLSFSATDATNPDNTFNVDDTIPA